MRAWWVALVVGCGACGTDDGGRSATETGVETSAPVEVIEETVEVGAETIDETVEVGAETIAETVGEVGAETVGEVIEDTIEDAEVAVETVAEVGVETVAEVIEETVDVGSEVTITGPQGQCGDSWDCPGTLFCADSAPGGICNGCSGNDPCPDGLWCNEFGSCSRDCETRADCPQGMRCHPTQTVCVLESCGDTDDCEAPYVCDGGMCRRPTCEDGVCPGPLVCVDAMCVEPYWAD